MVKRRRYAVLAALLLASTVGIDVIAKLGYLSDWSAAFDVTANVTLIAAAFWVLYLGIRYDRKRLAADPDNDY